MIALLLTAWAAEPADTPVPTTTPEIPGDELAWPPNSWRATIPYVPAFRMGIRGVGRSDAVLTGTIELGVEFYRRRGWALEANIAYQGPRSLRVAGPWRSMGSADLSVDLWADLGDFLAVGATAGSNIRIYRQQWQQVGTTPIPVVGLRTYSPLLRTRSWSVGLSTRITTDLRPTELVLDTTQVLRLSPIEFQVGMRFQLGHAPQEDAS